MLNFIATDVYALFKKSNKNLLHNVQNKAGGGQQLFEQCSKTADLVRDGTPYHTRGGEAGVAEGNEKTILFFWENIFSVSI